MGEALLWGLVAGSSLLVGAGLTFATRPSDRIVGLLLGFGSGTLISAVSYELVSEAFETSGGTEVWVGLAVGSLAYYVGDRSITARAGQRKQPPVEPDTTTQKAIVLGTVLDGIPEGIVLGMSFIAGGGSAAMIGAVFMSNLPEAVGATQGLETVWTRAKLFVLWTVIALATALASLIGFTLFDTASDGLVAFTQSFAAGALLTMVASTMLPKAYEEAKEEIGLTTVLGFAVALALAELA